MNCAKTVYAHPERAGEAIDPQYKRFIPGLGLTKRMILPHYQMIKDDVLDNLRAMEDIGILNSSYKKILRGRPRKYYDLQNEVNIHITINRNNFDVQFTDDILNTLQLPSGDEWSKLLDIEKRIDSGQLEAIDELRNQIRLYGNLLERAEYILERTMNNR